MIVPDRSVPRSSQRLRAPRSRRRSGGDSTSHVLVLIRSPPRIGKNQLTAVKVFMQPSLAQLPGR